MPSEAGHSRKHIGRLAQLVQSVCLTSRGSAVRIRQRPQEIRWNGSLAQLNRAFDYGSKGYRFESYRSHTRVQASSYWVDTRVAKWGRLYICWLTPAVVRIHLYPRNPMPVQCGNSSVGRAQPCQGWGREFESRFPLFDFCWCVSSVG